MAAKRTVDDNDFGRIEIRSRRSARNITMRVKPDGLHITAPPYSKTRTILEAVEKFRPQLAEEFRKIASRPIDLRFSLQSECFRLKLEAGDLRHFTLKWSDSEATLCCPKTADFSDPNVQKLVRNGIIRALKRRAAEFLPPLLSEWSRRFSLPYRKVRITGARSRWGSCSAARTISLSCYVMLLPAELMDYVMLHELAHTKEMNHGPRFWELLDRMTEGQAQQLRTALRKLRTDF